MVESGQHRPHDQEVHGGSEEQRGTLIGVWNGSSIILQSALCPSTRIHTDIKDLEGRSIWSILFIDHHPNRFFWTPARQQTFRTSVEQGHTRQRLIEQHQEVTQRLFRLEARVRTSEPSHLQLKRHRLKTFDDYRLPLMEHEARCFWTAAGAHELI